MGSLSSALLYSHFTLFPSHFAPLPFTLWTFPSLCTSLLCFFPFSLSLFTSSPLTLLFPPHTFHFYSSYFALFPHTLHFSICICPISPYILHFSPHTLHIFPSHFTRFPSHSALSLPSLFIFPLTLCIFLFDSQSTHKWPAKVWCQPSK